MNNSKNQKYLSKLRNKYEVSDEDRMLCYEWYESTDPDESKFGERWVPAGVDPIESVMKRVRTSLSVRRDKFDDGIAQLYNIWDVSKIAKEENKFYPGSHIDDFIREKIGYVKQSEVHNLPFEDMSDMVDDFITKRGQPKPVANLSSAQYDIGSKIQFAVDAGFRRILLEGAARSGKTIASSASALEINSQLTIIASYVKTTYRSFKQDLKTFEQFKDIVYVDTQDDDYIEQIDKALSEGKKVFAYLSLVSGKNRKKRINYLFGLDVNRYLIIDEADFGSWKPKQVNIVKNNIKKDDVLLLMTGTDADKASELWDIDYMISKTYFELLVDKKKAKIELDKGIGSISNPNGLKFFKKDIKRDLLYPDVQGYLIDLIRSVNKAIEDGDLTDSEFKNLPSWNKFVEDPIRAKGWFYTLIQSLFQGKHNLNELNIDLVSDNDLSKRRIAMMFFPYGTRKENMEIIVNMLKQILPEYEVVELSGNETTQKKAENLVKNIIKENPNKPVLIVSAIMGQRSFSIKQLDEVYLCYDRGGEGSTIQKMSRALTSNDEDDKVGKIFSLSFDSNRDDKFDGLILTSALNLLENDDNESDINKKIKQVCDSIDIFSTTENGQRIQFNPDEFVQSAIARKSIFRVMGKKTNTNSLPDEYVRALANSNLEFARSETKEAAKTGKTFNNNGLNKKKKNKKPNVNPPTDNMIKKAKETITAIYEHSDLLLKIGRHFGASNIKETFDKIEKENFEKDITDGFNGLDYEIIKFVFFTGIINENWVNIAHNN